MKQLFKVLRASGASEMNRHLADEETKGYFAAGQLTTACDSTGGVYLYLLVELQVIKIEQPDFSDFGIADGLLGSAG